LVHEKLTCHVRSRRVKASGQVVVRQPKRV